MASKKVKADTKKGKSDRKAADSPAAERVATKDRGPVAKVESASTAGKSAKGIVGKTAPAPAPVAVKASPAPVAAKPAPAVARPAVVPPPAVAAKAALAPVAAPAPVAAKQTPAPVAPPQPAAAAKLAPVARPVAAQAPVTPVTSPAAASFEALVSKLAREVGDGQEKIRREVDALRQEMKKAAAPPKERENVPATLEEDLDKVSRTFKRTLVDLVERNTERLCFPLATLERQLEQLRTRSEQQSLDLTEALAHCVSGLSAILEEIGVERFDAELHEVFDPMIHQSIGEKHHENVEAGRVVEAIAPGFRSSTGRILLPAQVLVNRR